MQKPKRRGNTQAGTDEGNNNERGSVGRHQTNPVEGCFAWKSRSVYLFLCPLSFLHPAVHFALSFTTYPLYPASIPVFTLPPFLLFLYPFTLFHLVYYPSYLTFHLIPTLLFFLSFPSISHHSLHSFTRPVVPSSLPPIPP